MDKIHLNLHVVSTADGSAALCLCTLFSFHNTVKSEDEETSVENKLRLRKAVFLIVSAGAIGYLKIAAPLAISLDFI